MSGIGLAGAHRTGKTTLAKVCSERLHLPFIETDVASVFKRMSFDPKKRYDFATRISIQWEILKQLIEKYDQANRATFITDRTPFDLVAYTIADINRDGLSEDDQETFMRYMAACFDVADRYFGVVVIVQPGIDIVENKNKANGDKAHMEHINMLLSGFAVNADTHVPFTFIPRHILDIDRRVKCVEESVLIASKAFESVAEKRGALIASHLVH